MAQILDFNKEEDQIEIQYSQSGLASAPTFELVENGSDYSIKLTFTFEASEANGNEVKVITKEVAVIKDPFEQIEAENVFLRAV